jgi:hypothetical protein
MEKLKAVAENGKSVLATCGKTHAEAWKEDPLFNTAKKRLT